MIVFLRKTHQRERMTGFFGLFGAKTEPAKIKGCREEHAILAQHGPTNQLEKHSRDHH